MPIFLIIAGTYFLIAGLRDKGQELSDLLQGDFTGKGSFVPWTLAILIVGALGYIGTLKPISDSFMALLIIVLMLHNGGFADKFFADFGIGAGGNK